jgi:uncharacterized membrane protein (DUF106 family)
MAMIIKTFYCYEIYNGLIESDAYYSGSSKILAGMAALVVQSGIIVAPIASMILSDSISIGYRIMIGGILGVILTSIKEAFTDTAMQKLKTELKEINSKMKRHDENHKRHDENHKRHDERLGDHDENMSNLRAEVEWNNPCKWVPWDPPSPK